jgi:glycosyltransferase involved in cell wall biosynthesis
MHVHYATVFNSRNIHLWSGLGYYIGKMLEDSGNTVEYLNDLTIANPFVTKLKFHLSKRFLGKTYSPNFEMKVAFEYARLIEERVPKGSLIFSPNTIILSHLDKSYKKVLFTDSTFQRLLNFYPAFTNISQEQTEHAQAIERIALQSCDLLIYSSKWAADSAINDYGADPEKIAIVAFGANLDVRISQKELLPLINRRVKRKEIHLVLAGISWFRKGGDYAMEVMKYLHEAGIEAVLHLVGPRKIPSISTCKIVNHGFISKSTIEGQQRLAKIFKESDFLLLPSRADCTPVVVCEANSFGLPCLISDVGGNNNVVSAGVNGMLFDFTKGPEECCKFISSMKKSPDDYLRLCQNSYNRFVTELNWQNSGKKISALLKSL